MPGWGPWRLSNSLTLCFVLCLSLSWIFVPPDLDTAASGACEKMGDDGGDGDTISEKAEGKSVLHAMFQVTSVSSCNVRFIALAIRQILNVSEWTLGPSSAGCNWAGQCR